MIVRLWSKTQEGEVFSNATFSQIPGVCDRCRWPSSPYTKESGSFIKGIINQEHMIC